MLTLLKFLSGQVNENFPNAVDRIHSLIIILVKCDLTIYCMFKYTLMLFILFGPVGMFNSLLAIQQTY